MAEKITIARPYAQAAFETAKENGTLEQWSDDLKTLAQIISDSDMQAVLLAPSLSTSQQVDLIDQIANEQVNEVIKPFLKVLAENKRLLILPTISQVFEKLNQLDSGLLEVKVLSAYILKPAQQKSLETALSKKFSRQVKITSKKDLQLIGGVKISAGDFVIDGSIKGQLTQLATQLGI